ncbi:MSHA biogenesis protein MshI [Marinobacter daqiaonensis]|uniref:MSHA biogenesis protein MshI n=1 Tax=Marinobacter daqiaonensis TaxID=650891 RepID=A0A1I6K107_9GAMM|nr:hypothetical protein [Marinobacter daqiaonensis]SFR84913.1 MSHA biogenesis protein MshI [Marinobacter daqiaonensis]
MPLTQIFQKLLNRSRSHHRISMEVRPDGIAWAVGGNSGEPGVGFIECTPAKRLGALQDFVAHRKLSGGKVELVLPLDQYQVFQLERPEGVEDTELADALKWKLRDVLEFSPSDSVSDVFPFPEDAARGRGELVNVVAARRSLVAELVALVTDADLDLVGIDIAELALRNLVARLDGSGRGAALVHLRDRFGHMVICKGPTLYLSRRLDVISDDLRDAARQESAVQSLALEVQRSLDYYESQLGQVPPPVVNLVARDTLLPLTSMLGGYLAATARTVDWSVFGLDRDLDSRCLLAWSSSIGLPEDQQ